MDRRLLSCVFLSLALAACHASAASASLAIPADATVVECVNPDNGFAWAVRLDARGKAVDGWPARFEARRISWRDGGDGGAYQLDRQTGALTIVRASSTGGYTSFDRCKTRP